jgi:hypothetical protein
MTEGSHDFVWEEDDTTLRRLRTESYVLKVSLSLETMPIPFERIRHHSNIDFPFEPFEAALVLSYRYRTIRSPGYHPYYTSADVLISLLSSPYHFHLYSDYPL